MASLLSPPGLPASGLATPALGTAANAALAKAAAGSKIAGKAKQAAQDFEAVFINTMFQQMFSSVGKGPFGGGSANEIWRSMLTDEYAKTFTKSGGIGIADAVHRQLLAQQEIR